MTDKEFLENFQTDVLNAVKEITYYTRSVSPRKASVSRVFACKEAARLPKSGRKTKAAFEKAVPLDKKLQSEKKLTESRKLEVYLKKAGRLIKDEKLLKYICPALQGLTEDIAEVAKSLTIALVPLSLAGTVTVPLNPYLYAMLAFIICKSGIKALCKNYKKNS